MSHLPMILDRDLLAAAIDAGHVRVQTHPERKGLRIYNYTDRAVYDRAWTREVRRCRGLIADTAGRIVARPWEKFFNVGEEYAVVDWDAPVHVTTKADGSLGILYEHDGEWAVATRGSFASEQAVHATAVYRDRYQGAWQPPAGWTVLMEIIYPENRIVLDYDGMDDLVLLGAVEIQTGLPVGPDHEIVAGWPGPRVEVHEFPSLAAAQAGVPDAGTEGFVVRYPDSGAMVKAKSGWYVHRHRLMTGLTARRLWERLAIHAAVDDGHPVKRACAALRMDATDAERSLAEGPDWLTGLKRDMPEEFAAWIDETVERLTAEADDLLTGLHRDARAAVERDLPRKELVASLAGHPHWQMVLSILDGKSIVANAWHHVRPGPERAFMQRSEAVA